MKPLQHAPQDERVNTTVDQAVGDHDRHIRPQRHVAQCGNDGLYGHALEDEGKDGNRETPGQQPD
jgi:hypothetical protein